MLTLIKGLGWQVKVAFICALVIGSFITGWTVHGWRFNSIEFEGIKKDLASVAKANKGQDGIVVKKQADEAKIKTVYRTIYRDIQNENSNTVCFTPDSLRLWNRSIAGADTHPQESIGATSQTNTASTRDILNNAAQNFEICNGSKI